MDDFQKYIESFSDNLRNYDKLLPLGFVKIEQTFQEITQTLKEPKSLQEVMMFFTCYSALRASYSLISGGAYVNVAPVLRQAHEAALYAFLFNMNPEFIEHWKNKRTDKKAQSIMRYEARRTALKKLKLTNARLESQVNSTYKVLLDLGAHPNALGTEIASTRSPGENGMGTYKFSFLGSQKNRELYLLWLCFTGVDALGLFKYVFPKIALEVSLDEKILQIKQHNFNYGKYVENSRPSP